MINWLYLSSCSTSGFTVFYIQLYYTISVVWAYIYQLFTFNRYTAYYYTLMINPLHIYNIMYTTGLIKYIILYVMLFQFIANTVWRWQPRYTVAPTMFLYTIKNNNILRVVIRRFRKYVLCITLTVNYMYNILLFIKLYVGTLYTVFVRS